MDGKMTLLSSYLDDGGWHTEAENVRNGVDLESYENELHLIAWLMAHLTQPSQAVDVGAIREVAAGLLTNAADLNRIDVCPMLATHLRNATDKLTHAIGNAQKGTK